jgi:hypothetical protein
MVKRSAYDMPLLPQHLQSLQKANLTSKVGDRGVYITQLVAGQRL